MKKIFLILTMIVTLGLSSSMFAYESEEKIKDSIDLIEMGVDSEITVAVEVSVIESYSINDSLNVVYNKFSSEEVSELSGVGVKIYKADRRVDRDNATNIFNLYSTKADNYNKYLSQNSDIKVKYLDYDIDRSRSRYRVKIA